MANQINIEKRIMEIFSNELTKFGIEDFFFTLSPFVDSDNMAQTLLPVNSVKNLKRQKNIVASGKRALQVRKDFISYYLDKETLSKASNLDLGPIYWTGPDHKTRAGKKLNALFSEYSVSSIVLWVIPTQVKWLGIFTLISSKPRNVIVASLNNRREELESILKLFGEYFSSTHIEELNPIRNFQEISDKSFSVLKLVAAGKSINEIAEQLYLSTRGVCYHIDNLKLALHCSNRSQLVDKAHRLGLL